MPPPKKWRPVNVCINGAAAGLVCGSGYAWVRALPLTTIEWLAFVGVTALAGAILLAVVAELRNWLVR